MRHRVGAVSTMGVSEIAANYPGDETSVHSSSDQFMEPADSQLNLQGVIANVQKTGFARFPTSRYTGLGRNDRFIRFLLTELSAFCGADIFLLGSGPLEPMSVASLAESADKRIHALERDRRIVAVIERCLETSILPLRAAHEICGVGKPAVHYRDNSDRSKNGLGFDSGPSHMAFDPKVLSRISVTRVDLTEFAPLFVEGPKLIFSGFFLVNVAKGDRGDRLAKFVLSSIKFALRSGGVFGTCTSYQFLKGGGVSKKSLMDLFSDTSLQPFLGFLNKMSQAKEGLVSSFGLAASAKRLIPSARDRVVARILTAQMQSTTRLGLKPTGIACDYRGLQHLLNRNDRVVLSFFSTDEGTFKVYSIHRDSLLGSLARCGGVYHGAL